MAAVELSHSDRDDEINSDEIHVTFDGCAAAESSERVTTVISENSAIGLTFNVMPNRPVTERLDVKEYRLGDRYIEAIFDREYSSSMLKSPSHLIFLTALIHAQKLAYVYLCNELGFHYDPTGPELLKIWPTRVDSRIPKLVRQSEGLVQQMWIREFEHVKQSEYRLQVSSTVRNRISFEIDAAVFVLKMRKD